MRLDIKKIDGHIRKLQEIRQIASDPEMVKILMEFLAPDEDLYTSSPLPKVAVEMPVTRDAAQTSTTMSDVDSIVTGVLEATASGDPNGKNSTSVLFPRKRL